jgi:5-methylcytosine-specific restriction protein A
VLVERGMCEKHRTRERYCKHPGCNKIVTDSNWCADHQPQRRYDDRRGPAAARGYDARWQQVRAAYLAKYPLCGRCQSRSVVRAADMVHHIVAIRDGGARLDNDNLLSLCWHCHGKVGGRGESVDQVMVYKRLYQSGSEAG